MNPRQVIQISFALNASLIIALFLVSGNGPLLQAPANYIFGSVVKDLQLRLYFFEGVLIVAAFIISTWAVNGVHAHGRHEAQVEAEM
jgi:hypothetical protein